MEARRRGAVVLALLVLAGAGLSSSAEANYAADFVGQCCFSTLEEGDTATNWFEYRNTGTDIWYRGGPYPVRLGTDAPENRTSAFFNPGDWIDGGRPSTLDQETVRPGEVGRFTFVIRAPHSAGQFREHYRPLAESAAWMFCAQCAWLDYTVLPAEPPTVRFAVVPERVKRGDPIQVSVEARDNLRVADTSFQIGSAKASVAAPAPGTSVYSATLDSSGLAAGTQTLVARARDAGGREAQSVAAIEITGPPAPGAPAAHKTMAVTVSYSYFPLRPRATTRFRHFVVEHIPKGSTVVARCVTRRGSPCSGALGKRFRRVNVSRRLAVPGFNRRYPAGRRLEVTVSHPEYRTQIKTVMVRRGKKPYISTRCQDPGSPRRTAC